MSTVRSLVTPMRSTLTRPGSRRLALVSTPECLVPLHSSVLLVFSLEYWRRSILLALHTISRCNSFRRCRKNLMHGTTVLRHTCAFPSQMTNPPREPSAAALLCWYVTQASQQCNHWLIITVINLPLHPCSNPPPSSLRLSWPTRFLVCTCSGRIF